MLKADRNDIIMIEKLMILDKKGVKNILSRQKKMEFSTQVKGLAFSRSIGSLSRTEKEEYVDTGAIR